MGKTVALDSNALTYLLDSVGTGYLPQSDSDPIAPERLAMLRLFCYSSSAFWVSPTVRVEYLRISDPSRRETHDRWARYQLEDVPPPVLRHAIEQRASELKQQHHHDDLDDCRIVAEAEAAWAHTLLTSDGDLIKDLGTATGVVIARPTEFLAALALPSGAVPLNLPATGNPLRTQAWWLL